MTSQSCGDRFEENPDIVIGKLRDNIGFWCIMDDRQKKYFIYRMKRLPREYRHTMWVWLGWRFTKEERKEFKAMYDDFGSAVDGRNQQIALSDFETLDKTIWS